ncbi:PhzF family isomerase [Vibrio coralliilyticus]|uniref:PhzF family isomerase n=1 Tax=Vibrio coralliilyticus TaxID=190893 RepID=UPI000C16A740|nr:PhzF family isomerase [Vibrio coralliilyticus]
MVTINVVDAFTTEVGNGNRAGVVLTADGLSTQQMQDIAAFAGYSETAFVLSSKANDHDLHIRYFTPTKEVPICGHATIAAHFLRAISGHHSEYPLTAKTGAGLLPVALSGSGLKMRVSMTQSLAKFYPPFNSELRDELANAMGISNTDYDDLPIQVVSTGHSKVIIPLTSRSTLNDLRPDADALANLSAKIGCNGFFPFVLEGDKSNPVTFGRMFAPAIGILEDPVTGNANGPTGAYLVHHALIECEQEAHYWGHQGHTLGKPGKVHVSVKKEGTELKIQIAGHAVLAETRSYFA